MGLFDINMPLLYGEGPKAFLRLQEEIIKRSNDQSLFAWTATPSKSIKGYNRDGPNSDGNDSSLMGGLLSNSPRDFEFSNNYVSYKEFWGGLERPYSMTNMGLCIDFPLIEIPGVKNERIVLLACGSTDFKLGETMIGLFIDLVIPGRKYKDGRTMENLAEHYYGARFINRPPISFRLNEFSTFGSKLRVSVYCKQLHCELNGVMETLYISQHTFVLIT
jgi:hypothetical protein